MAHFKNLSLYRFPVMPELTIERLASTLPGVQVRPCGPCERETLGFASPYSAQDKEFLIPLGTGAFLVAAGEEKSLPRSVLDARVRDATLRSGRPNGGSAAQRRALREQIETALLAEVLPRPFRMNCLIDLNGGWFGVDTTSGRRAEMAVSAMRMALRSFPARPLTPTLGPESEMTRWLLEGESPAPFAFGDACDLAHAEEQGAIWRGRKIDVGSEEVRGHLQQSFHVNALELCHANGLRFRLDGDLRLLGLRDESPDDAELYRGADDADSQLVAEVAKEYRLLTEVLETLESTFAVTRPGVKP